ncbi:hypothetical protein PFUGPA_00369 [Plasmodium falciparum Palo Alto/Uganda]|uniref:Uncharacterized protein n=5 Tax=Plasmodium falciparum TaxID=5833 RepID=A0A024WE90_PLAFA|nr:hypothetical protein PFFVO_00361 [Plasmodium falciparum Vietnam Oak-Knoll (FVO)]ETW38868.1 hypothetical protein PFTANZ_00418 [Plasmodium falciparum Tanzania (2000708)]ETW57676.1 hypothetical protein PFUGPA_00369 [Plasmodium falciparum Palo Alto/Uganda]ETW63807.1 hypothetical protein PFMC_00366 [Plasmodium falciparum CAMP/Malaysia]EUR81555.1 hypothetical protein PFBG_00225 [Plasmodium falciparum 7G8]
MLEENLHMYEIIGYFFGFGLLTGIRKSIHSIVATLAVYIKYVSFFFFFFLQNSPILWVACTPASSSTNPASNVVAIIIIVILVIILLVFLYYVIKESDFLENENFQKVIDTIQNCFDKYIKKIYIILL